MRTRTLRRTFYVVILPMTAVLTLAFFLLMQWFEWKDTYRNLNMKMDVLLRKEIEEFAYPLWIVNYERIEEIGQALFYDRDIAGINIYDESDATVISMGSTKSYIRETMDYLSAREESLNETLPDFFRYIATALGLNEREEKYFTRGKQLEYNSGSRAVFVGSVYLTLTDKNIQDGFINHFRLFMMLFLGIFSLISLTVSFAYYRTVQLPLSSIRAFIYEKEKMGLFDEDLPEEEKNNDLSYIKKRFVRIWNRQDELLKEQHFSKEYYRNLLNSLPLGIVLLDSDNRILESNFSFQMLSGYSDREITHMTMDDFTPEDFREKDQKYLKDLRNSGIMKPYEKKIKTRKGKEIPVRINGSSVSRGEEFWFIISIEDISERVDIEAELNRSYQFLDTASQIARVGGWELDMATRKLNWTREVYRIYGLQDSYEPDLESFYLFFKQKYRNIVKTAIDRAVKSGVPFEIEVQLMLDFDKETWVVVKGQPRYQNGKITAIHGTLQDITDRKNNEKEYHNLQKELGHKSRLDLIGQLASGVAHDFNNILGGIISSAEILKFKMKDRTGDFSKYIDIIISQSENAAMLSRRLLALSRKENYNKNSVNLNGLLKDTVSLLKDTLDRKINITLKMESESFAFIDYSSIQNAIMNICINSSHAMPDGGDLIIEKTTDSNSEGMNYEKIVITDSGTGIDEEHIGRIFEPFFTTKKEGQGTGLGLSAVKRTIEDHDGTVSVTSVEGEGTTMTLLIPSDQKSMAKDKAEKNVIFGKGRILLVDDETVNRDTGKEILESLGYTVLLAENGADGVETYRQNMESINLTILDMVMPVMDGYEAFEKIREINKEARVLILTGYADHKKLEIMKEKGVEDILKKPFQIPQLSQILAKILP
ncbi:PAS domain-containing hybrid sensor histidine kinase/response regulator [Spirochaeta isovalerica]|uniref:histidine kinase n=1 Tax=Spirochaeta isovalerica TaxID=150 RepID=A0A841R4W3_9SPIO|nr:PAS domain S-box protein [Spirochaeta isovalerica]MBB6480184.1 PAS domain S-box-containing protein [Spirochaeta isovalerica]